MLEFQELAFKQAATYCTNNLVKIPLKDQGAVYIGGVNGAGKSVPFNVLYNILFGYTPLSSKGKRKLIANPGYYAHVKFKLDDIDYEIRQFFDNLDFEYEGYNILRNGESLRIGGGIPEAERYIARLLPFTAEEFSSFYYLSQDGLHVLAYGKGSERLAYLSKVFGFDIYDQIRSKLKDKLDEVDEQLADVAKAQEIMDQLEVYLKKYPSLDLLERRIDICTQYLGIAKKDKIKLDALKCSIENKLTTLSTQENIQLSIQRYGIVRKLEEISADIEKQQSKQSTYQMYLKQWQIKEKLLQDFSIVKDYVNQDIFKLSDQLDSLVQQRGKAEILNRQLKQRQELISKINILSVDLTSDSKDIPQLAKQVIEELIAKRSLLNDKKSIIKDLSTLSKDGGKCSRCGQLLDSTHIKVELKTLSSEIVELESSIKQHEIDNRKFQHQLKLIDEIQKYHSVLESIENTSNVKIDITQLDQEIEIFKCKLNSTKEAQRLKKQMEIYKKYDQAHAKIIQKEFPKIQEKLKNLQKEFGRSSEKFSLELQLTELPKIVENKDRLKDIKKEIAEKIELYDEIIPTLTSDLREFITLKTSVSDYTYQIEKVAKQVSSLDKLNSFRKIVNTCYKAYLPSNLKKIQVSRVAELIAQKLNMFVPLIFNEKISFTVDANENSVDILFKRGEHAEKDVRFLNGGYKKRFLIALIPTLAGLINARKRTNLIILDEIDANIDSNGREAIGEFLIPFLKTKFKTVIIISPSTCTTEGRIEAPIPLDNFDCIHLAKYEQGLSSLSLNVKL
jgi:DNA repair exonuclease SbcCD ATPase subunit